jgi:hypothetical protein
MYRGVGWIYTPSSSQAVLPAIATDDASSPLELVCGYVLNVLEVGIRFRKQYDANPNVDIYDIKVAELSNERCLTNMFDFFDLDFDPTALRTAITGGPTNIRAEEKKLKTAVIVEENALTLERTAAAIESYRTGLANG